MFDFDYEEYNVLDNLNSDDVYYALINANNLTNKPDKVVHPGRIVRTFFGMHHISTTEASKELVIGRPALSCFLNLKSSLSIRLAFKLEYRYNFKATTLLKIQLAYDIRKFLRSDNFKDSQ